MNLTEIISITGKPGLYKLVSRTKSGLVVEALDETKKKFPVNNNYQIAVLEDITIFGEEDDNFMLKEVFEKMKERDGDTVPVSVNDQPAELRNYFREIAPNHDEERVYVSDIKKVIRWYNILQTNNLL